MAARDHGTGQLVGEDERAAAVDVEHTELLAERLIEEGADEGERRVVDQEPDLEPVSRPAHVFQHRGRAEGG